MKQACEEKGVKFYHPSPIYCTDNAAMIGAAAFYEYLAGTRHGWDLNAVPNLKLEKDKNMDEKKYCTAVVLAAGSGKRMGTKVHKQYLLLGGKPVLYYSLRAFEASR